MLAFGKGQALAAVAGADAADLLQREGRDAGHGRGRARGRRRAGPERHLRVLVEMPRRLGGVLHVEDGLVEEAREQVEADARGAPLVLGQRQVAAAGQVAEEVALAPRPLGVERVDLAVPSAPRCDRRMPAAAGGSVSRRERKRSQLACRARAAASGTARRGTAARARRSSVRRLPGSRAMPLKLARDQREARVDQGLAERHLAGHVVVAAAVGDAAAEHARRPRRAPPPWWWSSRGRCQRCSS